MFTSHVKSLSSDCLLESISLPLPRRYLQILTQFTIFGTVIGSIIANLCELLHMLFLPYDLLSLHVVLILGMSIFLGGIRFSEQSLGMSAYHMCVPVYYSFTYMSCRENVSDSRSPDLLIFIDASRGLCTAHLFLQVRRYERKFLYP